MTIEILWFNIGKQTLHTDIFYDTLHVKGSCIYTVLVGLPPQVNLLVQRVAGMHSKLIPNNTSINNTSTTRRKWTYRWLTNLPIQKGFHTFCIITWHYWCTHVTVVSNINQGKTYPGKTRNHKLTSGFVHLLMCLIVFETKMCKLFLVILCYILVINAFI